MHPHPIRLPAISATLLSLALATFLPSCRDATDTERPGRVASLEVVSGGGQEAEAGAVLPESLAVRALDGSGTPMPGVAVTWSVSANGGTVAPAASVTNAAGVAKTQWTLGSSEGEHTVTAAAGGAASTTVTARVNRGPATGPLSWTLVNRAATDMPIFDMIGLGGGSASDVFAVSDKGLVFRYNGERWSRMPGNPLTGHLYEIWGTASNNIYAAGITQHGVTTVYRYNGTSWETAYPGEQFRRLIAISGSSPTNIWAVGWDVVRYDGTRWSLVTPPGRPGEPVELSAVWVASPTAVFAADMGGNVYRYDGTAWTLLGTAPRGPVRALWGTSPSNVFAGDDGGHIIHWNGSGWDAPDRVSLAPISAIWGTSASDVWAVGGDALAHFDGTRWTPRDPATPNPGAVGVWGSSSRDAWVLSSSARFLHYDGTRWLDHRASWGPFYGVWGSSASDVWVCGGMGSIEHFDGSAWRAHAIPTTSWCKAISGSGSANVIALPGVGGTALRWDGSSWIASNIPFPNAPNDIWVVSPSAAFLATTSEPNLGWFDGTRWTKIPAPVSGFTAVWASSPTNVIAAGDAAIWRYDGTSWEKMPSGIIGTIWDLWGSSPTDVFAAGKTDVFHWDGTRWTPMNAAPLGELQGIHGRSSREVYAVGYRGTLLRYDGTRWNVESSGVTDNLYGVWASPSGVVYVTGDNKVLLRGSP